VVPYIEGLALHVEVPIDMTVILAETQHDQEKGVRSQGYIRALSSWMYELVCAHVAAIWERVGGVVMTGV